MFEQIESIKKEYMPISKLCVKNVRFLKDLSIEITRLKFDQKPDYTTFEKTLKNKISDLEENNLSENQAQPPTNSFVSLNIPKESTEGKGNKVNSTKTQTFLTMGTTKVRNAKIP